MRAPSVLLDQFVRTSESDTTARSHKFVPFQAPVLLRSPHGNVLGVPMWMADGEMFVVTDERLPLETDVEVAFVTRAGERAVRTSGHVSFRHETTEDAESDRGGMGIDRDVIGESA